MYTQTLTEKRATMHKIKLYRYLPVASLFIILLINFIFIVFVHWQWDRSLNKYLPLQMQIQTLKSDLSEAHLWLEEVITGDTSIDIEKDIMLPLAHRSIHIFIQNLDTILIDKEDEHIVSKLKKMDIKLEDFYTIARHRLEEAKLHATGSDLDQVFDRRFNSILSDIDAISLDITQRVSDESADRKYYFSWILVLFLLINSLVFFMLLSARRRQQNYYDSLLEEKERAVITLGSIGDAVITTDIKGNITFLNGIAEILTEYKNEEVQGKHIDSVIDLYNTKTGKKIITPISDVINKGITKLISNGTKLVTRTGKEYILSDTAAAVISKEGEILGTVMVFQNDTERYAMEDALKKSESKYRSLVENVKQHYFFYAYDTEEILTYVSNSLTDVLGYSKEAFKTHYTKYLTDDPMNKRAKEFREKAKKGKLQEPYNLSIYHYDGLVCYLEVVESPVFNSEGEVISIEGVARDITDNYLAQKNIKEQKELLAYRANHDALTDLPNRQLFLERLTQSIKYAQRFAEKVGVLFIDLDHFKEINDSLGHHVGDELLKRVSHKLQQQIRETDTLARLGGDEFIIILDTLDDTNIIIDIIKKLMDIMNQPILIEEKQLYITLSIGVSIYPDDGKMSEELLKNADAAMYNAKDNGRNTYCFYTKEMTQKAFARIEMETSLRQAVKREEFVVYYHPQIDGIHNDIVGIEALVRWNHPKKGMLLPEDFIFLAEEIGLMIPIDRWVMKKAMDQLVQWYKEGLNPGKLALNLSMKQLVQPDFIEVVSSLLKQTGCQAQWIIFEITETQVMKDPERSILILKALRKMNIELAIDDFGTGYSSLSYLKRLPIDKLKIDQSFVKGLPHDNEDSGIVKALITLSKSLKLSIIAEGVETVEQKNFLIENGCTMIQGYLYAKPMPCDDIKEILK